MTANAWVTLEYITATTKLFRDVMTAETEELMKVWCNNSAARHELIKWRIINDRHYLPQNNLLPYNPPFIAMSGELENLIKLANVAEDKRVLIDETGRRLIASCLIDPSSQINSWIEQTKAATVRNVEELQRLKNMPLPPTPPVTPPPSAVVEPHPRECVHPIAWLAIVGIISFSVMFIIGAIGR